MEIEKVETYGSIKEGRIYVIEQDKFMQNAILKYDGCRIKMTIEKLYDNQSQKQFGYYFAVIVKFFQRGWKKECGEDISLKESHDKLKYYCNYREMVNYDTGEIIRIPMSTKNMDTVTREEFHERARKFIWEWFGLIVPLPEKK